MGPQAGDLWDYSARMLVCICCSHLLSVTHWAWLRPPARAGLPLPYSHEPLLCEVLFSQMLRLPRPQFKPIMYATLMVDLCKLKKLFPRAMSACVRESFARMEVLDPGLRGRLAEWLAYHLSNFEYVWPWAKWEHVLAAPPYDAQRRFCVAVINRLVRLSYWDRVKSVLPDDFRALLPPKPEVAALPSPEDPGAADSDLEGFWAARAVERVRAKATAGDLEEWVQQNALETVLGGQLGVLRMLGRCLLVAGSKSYTHMVIALERYYGPVNNLVLALGLEVGLACPVLHTGGCPHSDVWVSTCPASQLWGLQACSIAQHLGIETRRCKHAAANTHAG